MNSNNKLAQKLAAKAPHLAMVFVTMIWGTTYLLVQHGLTASSPMFFVACRFAAASVAVGLISFNQLKHFTRHDVWAAMVIGFSITIGYGAQTIGLQYITSSESAFFTALFVPFVPFILFVACRFAAASVAVGLISFNQLKHFTRHDVWAAMVIGFSITIGYGAQTIGLQYITSSESAFFTALFVPFVPFILWIGFKKVPHMMSLVGIVLAFVGLLLLSGNGLTSISFNFGQLITILSAFAVATEIILISHFAPKVNLQRVTVLQLVFASLFAFLSMPLVGETTIPPFSTTLVTLTVGLGLASAFIQLVMNWSQRVVAPSTAAVIYAGEPVWAGIFGRMAGERLPPIALLGGALVVASILISEYRPKKKPQQQSVVE